MVKRKLDKEAGDIKERESKRLHEEKHARQHKLQEAAETAEGCADFVVEGLDGTIAAEKKDTLTRQCKAALQVLKEEQQADKQADKQAARAAASKDSKGKADDVKKEAQGR